MAKSGEYRLSEDGKTAFIPLSKGLEAVIDATDLALVTRFGWQAWSNPAGNIYAVTKSARRDGKRKTIKMHRLLVAEGPRLVDHISGDGLDNRRANLRAGDHSLNNGNTFNHRNGGAVGLYHDRRRGTYSAYVPLGTFPTADEARAAILAARAILEP